MYLSGKSIHSWCDGLSDRSFMVDSSSYSTTGVTSCVMCGLLYGSEMYLSGKSIHSWVVGSILHGGPIELFLIPASATRLV